MAESKQTSVNLSAFVRWPFKNARAISRNIAFLALLPLPLQASVNDAFPGDFFPVQPQTNLVTLYAYDRAQAGPYVQGRKTLDGHLDSRSLAARLTHGFQVGDTTLATTLVLPWLAGTISPPALSTALGGDARGLMDLRIALSAWLINDKEHANYLALGGMVVTPTGDYDNRRVLNPGENRWKTILAAGWQKDITPQWLFELSPEYVHYGDNADYPGQRLLEQRPSWAFTGYLRYRASAAWHVHLGGQINRGGETRLAGVPQNNPANNNRVMAGMTWFLPERQQIILRLARDTGLDNGFRTEREVALRYQKAY